MKTKTKWRLATGQQRIAVTTGFVLLALPLAWAQIGAPIAQPAALSVDSQRPLSELLPKVEQLTYTPVNLEDIPYQNLSDLTLHDFLLKDGTHFRPISPRGGKLQVSLVQGQPACDAVKDVLSAYSGAALPGTYTALCYRDRVDVVPSSFNDAGGVSRTAVALMTQPISFPEAERSVAITFQLIADSIASATGTKVLLGRVPFPENTYVTVGASQEGAESIIARMAPKLRPMAFWLGYDPWMNEYYLSMRLVPLVPVVQTNAAPQNGAGPGIARPTKSPFFVKVP